MQLLLLFFGTLWLISYISKRCDLALIRNGHSFLVYLSSMIGVPTHELSHYFFCKIFRHKVLKVRLFSPTPDGQLGFVEHSYNPASFYQKVGLFFIGIAPIIGGAIVIATVSRLMWPQVNFDQLAVNVLNNIETFGVLEGVGNYLLWSKELHQYLFDASPTKYILWGIVMLSTLKHIFPSGADMKGVILGLPTTIVIAVISWMLAPELVETNSYMFLTYLFSILCSFGCILLFFQLSMVLISTCIRKGFNQCSNLQ